MQSEKDEVEEEVDEEWLGNRGRGGMEEEEGGKTQEFAAVVR